MTSAPLFSALLTPHRTLDQRGLNWVIAITALLAAIPGLMFFAIGAWPIVGLMGLDVLALWWALKASQKSGAVYEEVTLWRHALEIRHVTAHGREQRHEFNPFWVRLNVKRDYEDRVTRIALNFRNQELEIGRFLTPGDKADFAEMLSHALHRAKN